MVFVPNPNFVRQFEQERSYKDLRNEAAERTLRVARTIAPVRTGSYRDSLYVNEETGSLCSSDFFAAGIEFGSVNNPAYAPCRRAVRAAGYRLAERSKP